MAPDSSEATGGCYCGAVRYRAAGPPIHATLCFCADCRRTTGGHPVPWVTFSAASFEFMQGEPAAFRSSPPVVRTFCGRCGTSLTYRTKERPDEVDVTTASLDDPARYPPQTSEYEEEKLPWA